MKRSRCAAALVAASALAALAAAADLGPTRNARLDAWRVIGPGGGGTMRRPAISPHDPKVVLLGCDMTGAYVTGDGGASWRMFNLGSVPTAFAFDPSRPQTLYAGAEAVYRSDDAGRTWRMVLPDPAKNTVARPIGDHGDRVIFTDDPAYPGSGRSVTVHAIAVDEDDPSRVYVAASAADSPVPGHAGLADAAPRLDRRRADVVARRRPSARSASSRSAPTAARRRRACSALGETRRLRGRRGVAGSTSRRPAGRRFTSGQLRPRPALGRRVRLRHAAARRRTGGGDRRAACRCPTTAAAPGARPTARCSTAVREVGRGRRVGTGEGLAAVAGADRGLRPLPARGLRGPARHRPARPRRRAVQRDREDDGRRTDVERRPRRVGPAVGEPRRLLDRAARRGGRPLRLVRLPVRPRGGAERPRRRVRDRPLPHLPDDGRRRGPGRRSTPSAAASDRWTTRGLDVTTTYGIQFDPHDPQRVFIPYTDIGLFRSEDGGETWTGSTTGIPTRWRNTTYWLAFDPEVKDLVWGGFSGTHDLPRPKMWRRTDPARFRGGVARLDRRRPALDARRTRAWRSRRSRTCSSTRRARRAAARSTRPRSAAASTSRPTTGARGRCKNAGLAPDPRNQPFAWRLTLAPDGALYLVVARRSERGRIGDRGRRRALPLDRRRRALAGRAAARRHERAERPHRRPGGPEAALPLGLGRDAPGRRHGRRHLPQHRRRRDVASRLHRGPARLRRDRRPARPEACSTPAASTRPRSAPSDRGETWTRIRGFNFKWGQRVDPRPAGRLEDLRHHLRRQRLARPRGRRPDRHGGRRPAPAPRPSAPRARRASSSSSRRTSSARTRSRWRSRGRRARATRPATRRARSPTRSSPRSRRTRPP